MLAYFSSPAVSQTSKMTDVLLMWNFLCRKSTPTVVFGSSVKYLSKCCNIRLVFPTPYVPTITNLNRYSLHLILLLLTISSLPSTLTGLSSIFILVKCIWMLWRVFSTSLLTIKKTVFQVYYPFHRQ